NRVDTFIGVNKETTGVAFSPIISGNLYVAVTTLDGNVYVFTVDQTTGALMVVGFFPTGALPVSVAFSPVLSGNLLFAAVANSGDGTASVYSVNPTSGVFTQVPSSPFASGSGAGSVPFGIAFSPIFSGTLFAAMANAAGTLSVYTVNQGSGFFAPVAGSPFSFASFSLPDAVAFSPVI